MFQPYSGVKTSILLLDRKLAPRRTASSSSRSPATATAWERRAVAHNDLPDAAARLKAWTASLRDNTPFDASALPNVHVVVKSAIAATTEYNLSGDRYMMGVLRNSDYQLLPFNEVCTLEYGESLPAKSRVDGIYPVLGSNGIKGAAGFAVEQSFI